jgi:hypothetical protein
MHLSEDVLQAYRDRELPEQQTKATREHLEMCTACQDLLSQMEQSQSVIQTRLDTLIPDEHESPEADILLKRLKTAQTSVRKSRWKPAWAAVVAICALAAALYLEPVRVWAAEFLSLFRVQQITVVRIDPANVKQLEEGLFGRESERRIEQFLSDNAHITKRGERQTVQNVNEAARLAGFGIRMPTKLEAPLRMHVQPAVDASFQIDVERLQGILDDAGRSDIKIPEDLDGKNIQVNIPASVTALFGKCPDAQEDREISRRERMREYTECKMLVQLPTPVVVAPPALNIAALGMEMLKLFGFTDEQARAFSESIDWATTLVVPLPFDDKMNVVEVDVDGVKGQLFSSRWYQGLEDRVAYNLLWIRDGHLYSLMGRGTADEAIAIANSL